MVRTGWKTFFAVLPAVLFLAPAASAADVASAPAGRTSIADNPFAPPPLSEECSEFCGLCAEETRNGKKKNGMCERVEAKCGCAAHAEAVAEAERLFAEKAAKDSADKAAKVLRSTEAAQRIFDFCEKETAAPLCSVTVVLDRAWFAIVDLRLFKPAPPPPPPAPVVVQQPVAQPAPRYAPAPQEEKRDEEKKDDSSTKAGTSFGVIEWGLGMTREDHYGQLDFRQTNGFEMSLLYLKRLYFYEAGSFQLGLGLDYNAIMTEDEVYISSYYYGYHYTDLYDYKLFHHGVSLEIPVGLRLGLPIKSKFKPFVSENIAFRHTIHESAYIDVVDDDGDGLWKYHWPEFGDWAFMAWFGAGVEGERFSLEFRWMEYSGRKGSAQDFRRNWRFALGFGL